MKLFERIRKLKGLKLYTELQAELGWTFTEICRLETGKSKLTKSQVEDLSRVLGGSVQSWLDLKDP